MNGFEGPMILHVVWLKYNATALGISSGRIYYWMPVKQDISLLFLLPLFLWFQTYSNALGLNCMGQSVSTTSVETQRHWADVTSWLGIAKGGLQVKWWPRQRNPTGPSGLEWNWIPSPLRTHFWGSEIRFQPGQLLSGWGAGVWEAIFISTRKKCILIIGY